MREEFRADLLEVGRLLVSMAEAVRTAMSAATTALLSADKEGAERVVARDEEINALFRAVEEKVLRLLAQQAPVASDLRMVITALHIGTDLERMGDLAEHVAKSALRRHPASAVPPELTGVFGQMANDRRPHRRQDHAGAGVPRRRARRRTGARRRRHGRPGKALFEMLLNADWTHGVEAAVDAALLARFYERYADHAVNAGRHVIYLVTGES